MMGTVLVSGEKHTSELPGLPFARAVTLITQQEEQEWSPFQGPHQNPHFGPGSGDLCDSTDPLRKEIFGRNNGSDKGHSAMPPGIAAQLLSSHLYQSDI